MNHSTRFIAAATILGLPAAASAAPLAASVGMPSHVVAGIIVGVVLLAAFVSLMLRTFRNMQNTQEVTREDEAAHEARGLVQAWSSRPSMDTLRSLIDGLRESSSPREAESFSQALIEISGRHFGTDDVAWEVWLRREGQAYIASLAPRDRSAPPAGEVLRVS